MNNKQYINIVSVDFTYYTSLEAYYNTNNKTTPTKISFIVKDNNPNQFRPFVTFDDFSINKKTIKCYPLSSYHFNTDCDLRRKMHHFIVRKPANIVGKIVLNCPIEIPKQFLTIINTNPNFINSLQEPVKSWYVRCYDEKKHCRRNFKLIQSHINEYFVLNKKDHKRYPVVNKVLIDTFNKQFIK